MMKTLCLLVLTLSLPALPAQAVTIVAPSEAPKVLMTDIEIGVVERFTSTSIQVGGRTFFWSPATPVYDRNGNRLGAPRIEPGTPVKFTLADETSRQRIKELWINK